MDRLAGTFATWRSCELHNWLISAQIKFLAKRPNEFPQNSQSCQTAVRVVILVRAPNDLLYHKDSFRNFEHLQVEQQ